MSDISVVKTTSLLERLFFACGWRNDHDTIFEAMPHMSDRLRAKEVFKTLENLNIPFSSAECREVQITNDECPALVIPKDGEPYVALEVRGRELIVITPGDDVKSRREASRESVMILRIDQFTNQTNVVKPDKIADIFSASRAMAPWLALSSLLTNLLGLATPLLIMVIYDRIIPSNSTDLLLAAAAAVGIILVSDALFRHARTAALAHVGRQGEQKLSVRLFQKLLSLPMSQLQKSDVEQQIARFKQFESFRELFTGQIMTVLLDLPFVLIFIGVLSYISFPIGLITLLVILIFAVSTFVSVSVQQRLDQSSFEASAAHRAHIEDAAQFQKTIVNLGMQKGWLDRNQLLAAKAEEAARKARQFQASMQSFGQTILSLATVSAIVISAYSAMTGAMTFGALIAVIALVSKVFAPVQALAANMPQIISFRRSRVQAERVLALPEESERGLNQSHQKTLSGTIQFRTVTHRPDPTNPPVLSQVAFEIDAGELVVVMGNDIAGRTALLDLIDGLHQPLAGSVEHDEIDIRQIARDELRRSVSYATMDTGFFYGTIEQNFRLAAPSLGADEIRAALHAMALQDEIDQLPDGFDTRLTDAMLAGLPFGLLKSLTLARTIARDTPIHLYAEPTSGLDKERRQAFRTWVQAQKSKRTVILATPDRSFLSMADRFLYLDSGRMIVNDKGESGLKKINAALAKFGG
ncbi:MAG: ABC transporter transmembrane domain-containing protein [Pseudomonadota bacterium]